MQPPPPTPSSSIPEQREDEKRRPRRRVRLIVRLGAFLVSHSILFSCVCCTGGVVALLLLPILAKNTYISENALMPGSAKTMLSVQDSQEAERLIKALIGQNSSHKSEITRLIAKNMAGSGADVYYHRFHPQRSHFHPVHFLSSATGGISSTEIGNCSIGMNSVGIIRAPRGDGKESIVLITPYNSQKIEVNDAVSLGLGFAIFSFLSKVTWLAKDIVWVASDSQFGEYTAVSSWLDEYHNPQNFGRFNNVEFGMCSEKYDVDLSVNGPYEMGISDAFKRAGTMAAGLIIKVVDKKEASDSVTIYSEASNGQMPNLDLINIVHYLAVHRQAFRVKVGSMDALRNWAWLNFLGRLLESLNNIASSLNTKWNFGILASDYVDESVTLASSIYNQAIGIPTGSHGAFRDYQIDAITLEISPRVPLNKDLGKTSILIRGGRLVEGVVRSVNNLLEKFHQSFFLYLLTSPNKFVSVGVYMISFALLVAPLPIAAAALFSNNHQTTSNDNSKRVVDKSWNGIHGGWQWIHAARVALSVHLWALVVTLLPWIIIKMPATSPMNNILVWFTLSIMVLLIFYLTLGSPYSAFQPGEWRLQKMVMISAASIGLCLMSIINFATAQLGCFFLVPMCLLVKPLKRSGLRPLSVFNAVMGVVGFPPAAVLIFEGLSRGYENVSIANLWEGASLLWSWNSATYLYIFLIHLPCWVLFVLVLLHP